MKAYMLAGLVAALTSFSAAQAQVASSSTTAGAVVATERAMPTGNNTFLPSNTEIWLVADQEVNSKMIKQGDQFPLSVSRDVMIGNFVVIPRGTAAHGQISYRTGKGAFGKSAKMEFDLVDIELNGRLIPVSGHYRVEGQGNTGAAVGAVVAVGVFGAFVTGRSAIVPEGTEYRSYTKEQMPVVLASASAPQTAAAGSATASLQK